VAPIALPYRAVRRNRAEHETMKKLEGAYRTEGTPQ
jgi:hypothetical protein